MGRADLKIGKTIPVADIVRVKKDYPPGKKIRVLRRDMFGEVGRDVYEVVKHFPHLVLIKSTTINRMKEQGADEETLKRMERVYTTTITNTQLVLYAKNGKKGIIL